MKIKSGQILFGFLFRFVIALILLMHGITGMLNGDINAFGSDYLNAIGFAPFGIFLAWFIKLSHVITAILLLINKWLFYPILLTIFILIMGIVMIHFKAGWFVIGGGKNGMEFNLLLIAALLEVLGRQTNNIKSITNM